MTYRERLAIGIVLACMVVLVRALERYGVPAPTPCVGDMCEGDAPRSEVP